MGAWQQRRTLERPQHRWCDHPTHHQPAGGWDEGGQHHQHPWQQGGHEGSGNGGAKVREGDYSTEAGTLAKDSNGEGAAGAEQPSVKSNSVSHGMGRLPSGKGVVLPAHAILAVTKQCVARRNNTVNSILSSIMRGKGPGVIGRVSRIIKGADASANRQADMDRGSACPRLAADGEPREDKEGKVGDAKGARAANGGTVEISREGKATRAIRGKQAPLLPPLGNVAVLIKPAIALNPGVKDDETVIKRGCITVRVVDTLREEGMEAGIGRAGIKA